MSRIPPGTTRAVAVEPLDRVARDRRRATSGSVRTIPWGGSGCRSPAPISTSSDIGAVRSSIGRHGRGGRAVDGLKYLIRRTSEPSAAAPGWMRASRAYAPRSVIRSTARLT
jgi:hypothetical protein